MKQAVQLCPLWPSSPNRQGLALAAPVCLGAGVVSGCSGNEVQAQQRLGAQATPWEPPCLDMPDAVPPNVKAGSYPLFAAAQLGPSIDPEKGYRAESMGSGVYVVGDGNYNAMVLDVGVVLADAPPTLGDKLPKAIRDVAPGGAILALEQSIRVDGPSPR